MAISEYSIEELNKVVDAFHKEHNYLASLKNEDRITFSLKDKYLKMDNGQYRCPSFNGYTINGNFIGFRTAVDRNGRDVLKRVSFDSLQNSRLISFSKKEKSLDGISMADFLLASPFVEGSANCKKGTGILEVYDVESRQTVSNNEIIENAKLTIALASLRKDDKKLTAIASIVGCDHTAGVETKINHLLNYSRKGIEQREYVSTLIERDSDKELIALSVYNTAKAMGIVYHEGKLTRANIDTEKILIVQSLSEETIVRRLLADDGVLLDTLSKEITRIDKETK